MSHIYPFYNHPRQEHLSKGNSLVVVRNGLFKQRELLAIGSIFIDPVGWLARIVKLTSTIVNSTGFFVHLSSLRILYIACWSHLVEARWADLLRVTPTLCQVNVVIIIHISTCKNLETKLMLDVFNLECKAIEFKTSGCMYFTRQRKSLTDIYIYACRTLKNPIQIIPRL